MNELNLDTFPSFSQLLFYLIILLAQTISTLIIRKTAKSEAEKTRYFTDMRVRALNGITSAIIHNLPGPCWLKLAEDDDGVIKFKLLEMNDSYEKAFKKSRHNCIGKTDFECGWPKELADEFYKNDLLVYTTGESRMVDEKISLTGEHKRFIKIRLISPDGVIKGVLSYCADANQFCNPEKCVHLKNESN